MSNFIHNASAGPEYGFSINNGYTELLISALVVSGSALAREDYEVDLITWLASRDQGVVGSGIVGFDIRDLPWDGDRCTFGLQKRFLNQVFARVESARDIEAFGYRLGDEVNTFLTKFGDAINAFQYEFVTGEKKWLLPPNPERAKCPIHGVFLHEYGCILCN